MNLLQNQLENKQADNLGSSVNKFNRKAIPSTNMSYEYLTRELSAWGIDIIKFPVDITVAKTVLFLIRSGKKTKAKIHFRSIHPEQNELIENQLPKNDFSDTEIEDNVLSDSEVDANANEQKLMADSTAKAKSKVKYKRFHEMQVLKSHKNIATIVKPAYRLLIYLLLYYCLVHTAVHLIGPCSSGIYSWFQLLTALCFF